MKFSSTMTALALAMMTVAGCSTMSEKSEPAAEMKKDTMVEETVVDTVPMESTGETMVKEVMVEETMVEETMVDGTMVEETMVEETVMEETMVTETVASDDAAINACISAGGQIVSWVGDSSGAEQACRREDGLEYRLADAQYYQ